MSWMPAAEPAPRDCAETPSLRKVIEARARQIDDFSVGRLLPSAGQRMVGPYVFFDHMGPARLAPGRGMDVRPHPHINLATVTYLFEGAILHRDSLGSHQVIRPGEINWMTAGRGIAHSERTPDELRPAGPSLHGIQLWVALPDEHEETAPGFHHHDADSLPTIERDGVRLRVLIGSAFGVTSPVAVFSPMFYVEAQVPAGAVLPVPDGYAERAAYVVDGALVCGPERVEDRHMAVFEPQVAPVLRAERESRVMLIGGEPIGPRHIWWNFVSSSEARIEQARQDWREGRFGLVPGDEHERIPLPDRP